MKQKKIQRKSNDDDLSSRSAENDDIMDTSREGADDSAGEEGHCDLAEARVADSEEGRVHDDSSDERSRSLDTSAIGSTSQRHEGGRDLRHAHFLHGRLAPHLQLHHHLQHQGLHHSHHPLYPHRHALPSDPRNLSSVEKEFAPNFLDRDRDRDFEREVRSRPISERGESEDEEDNEEINVVDPDQTDSTSSKPIVP